MWWVCRCGCRRAVVGNRLFLGRADSRECCIHRQTGFGFTTIPDRQMACAPRSPWPMALAACLCPSNVDSFRFLSASPPFLPKMVAVGWCAPKTKGQARWLQHSSRLARDLPIPDALLRVPFASGALDSSLPPSPSSKRRTHLVISSVNENLIEDLEESRDEGDVPATIK